MRIALVFLAAIASFVPATLAKDSSLTFNKDIAPIIFANCSSCHRPGEVAPFSLLTYADVKKRAAQIVRVTQSRYMPPWKAEATADFIGARRLNDVQLDAFNRWAKDGAAEGDPDDLPKQPQFVDGWQLGTPDLVAKMPKPFEVPADGLDIYRNFVVPLNFPAGKFLKAVEFRPGNPRVVHHAVLSTVLGSARFEDSGAGVDSGLSPVGTVLPGSVGIWAPGKSPLPLPTEFALAWPDEAQLVLQLHLHPSGKPEVEQSSIGFYFTDKPPRRRINSLPILNKQVSIAADEKDHRITQSYTLPRDLEVIGQFPHMHLLGRTVTANATLPSGKTTPLLSISDWDFNWQTYYQFAIPMKLPKGSRIEVEWSFDNSSENPRNPSHPPKPVTYGEQTTNEMAVLLFEVVSDDDAPPIPKGSQPQGKKLKGVEASKFGELLCNEADRLVDPPFRIAANTDAALGMQGDNRGLLIVPDANLTAEKLKKLDNEVLPLGLLFTHNISPVMADKVIAASQQVAVELIKPDGKVPLHVTHLAATRVAGQLVLLAYTKSSEPPLITTLVEIEETVSAALTVAAHRISEKRGILLLTAFGRYRATIEIADMDEGVPTAPR